MNFVFEISNLLLMQFLVQLKSKDNSELMLNKLLIVNIGLINAVENKVDTD